MAPKPPCFERVETLWIPITFALHHYKVTLKKKRNLKNSANPVCSWQSRFLVHSGVWVTGQTCFVPHHMECMLWDLIRETLYQPTALSSSQHDGQNSSWASSRVWQVGADLPCQYLGLSSVHKCNLYKTSHPMSHFLILPLILLTGPWLEEHMRKQTGSANVPSVPSFQFALLICFGCQSL